MSGKQSKRKLVVSETWAWAERQRGSRARSIDWVKTSGYAKTREDDELGEKYCFWIKGGFKVQKVKGGAKLEHIASSKFVGPLWRTLGIAFQIGESLLALPIDWTMDHDSIKAAASDDVVEKIKAILAQ